MAAAKRAEPSARRPAPPKTKTKTQTKLKTKTKAAATAPSSTKKKRSGPAPQTPHLLPAATRERVFATLRAYHADAHCELDHQNPFQLLVATVLSAQATDVMVNRITPGLFRRWPTPARLAQAEPAEVEAALNRIGMFRQKTKNVIGLSKRLIEKHGGEVPRSLAELIELPGVGRKTANVVLGVAFGTPEGVVVDTHVQRISQRLGFTRHTEPPEIELDLMRDFPRAVWDPLSHILIFHGRRICTARNPACAACPVNTDCPSAFNAERVGRKPVRIRVPAKNVKTAKNARNAKKPRSK